MGRYFGGGLAGLIGAMMIGCEASENRTTATLPVATNAHASNPGGERNSSVSDRVEKTDEEWRKILPPQAYEIARCGGTERAFTGQYWNHHAEGMYRCVACGEPLFSSETKFDSGTGWPSFWDPASKEAVRVAGDLSHGMQRDEVVCRRCEAHLGHVFDDGPRPTGMRYCINSASLKFEAKPK